MQINLLWADSLCSVFFFLILFFLQISFHLQLLHSCTSLYIVQGLKITAPPSPEVCSYFIVSLQVLGSSPKSVGHVTLADEEISIAMGERTLRLWHIRLSLIFFFSAPEWHVHVHLTFDIEGMPFCCSLWDCDSACPNLNWWRCGSSTKSSLYLSARTIYVH